MGVLLDRFSGPDGERRLLGVLTTLLLVGGNAALASDLQSRITLHEIATGDLLIKQDGPDNDVFLILGGAFKVLVHSRQVAMRGPGHHVGEMVALNPALTRTATVIAVEPSIVAKLSESNFSHLLDNYPAMWKPIALELSRRLDERKQFHKEPNKRPVVFIGCSKESLHIAEALYASIPADVAEVILWSMDVFGASRFPIEELEARVQTSDFAVLVCAADDHVVSRGVDSDAPRDNVVFELGLFMGSLTRYRTFVLEPSDKKVKIPSDLLGIGTLRFDPNAATPAAAVADAVKRLVSDIQRNGPR